MTQEDRSRFAGPIAAGAGHVILVFGLLSWFDYPLALFDGTAILQILVLIVGLFLLTFVPVLLFIRARLIVPIGIVPIGFGIAIVAEFTTPAPDFAALNNHVLVIGPTYLGTYANGWYVWLLAYGLGGLCEHAVRTHLNSIIDTQVLSGWHLQFDRRWSVLLGCAVGLVHAAVFITLGIERGGELLSGWLLGWGILGVTLLGSIPVLLLIRHQLIIPSVGLVAIVLTTGIEALTMTDGTPVSSYMLFWPVYFVLILLLAIGEWVLRLSYRRVMICYNS